MLNRRFRLHWLRSRGGPRRGSSDHVHGGMLDDEIDGLRRVVRDVHLLRPRATPSRTPDPCRRHRATRCIRALPCGPRHKLQIEPGDARSLWSSGVPVTPRSGPSKTSALGCARVRRPTVALALAVAMRARASSSAKCGLNRMNSATVMPARSGSKAVSYVADAGATADAGCSCFLFMVIVKAKPVSGKRRLSPFAKVVDADSTAVPGWRDSYQRTS